MNQTTSDGIDSALLVLSRFTSCGLDAERDDRPSLEEVRGATSEVIDHFGFNREDYEIRDLLRVIESKKSISYAELLSHLKHLVPYAEELRCSERHNEVHGWPEGDPFLES